MLKDLWCHRTPHALRVAAPAVGAQQAFVLNDHWFGSLRLIAAPHCHTLAPGAGMVYLMPQPITASMEVVMPRACATASASVFQVLVTLKEIAPAVWRRLLLPRCRWRTSAQLL